MNIFTCTCSLSYWCIIEYSKALTEAAYLCNIPILACSGLQLGAHEYVKEQTPSPSAVTVVRNARPPVDPGYRRDNGI